MTRICFSTLSIVLIAFSQVISAKAIPEGGGSYKAPAPKPAAPAPRVSTPAPRPSTPVARAEGGGGYVPPKTATPPTPAPRPSTPVARAEGGGGYVPPKTTTQTPAVTPAPTPSRPVARAEGGGGYVPPKTTTQTPAVTPAPTPSRPVARAEGGGGYVPPKTTTQTPAVTPAPTPSRPVARAEGGGAYVPPTPAVPKLTPAQEKTKFEIERYAKNNGYTPEQTAALVYRSMTPEKQRNADAAAAAAAREKLTGMTAAQEKTKAQIEKYAANNGYTEQQTKDLVYRSMTTAKQREADALKAKEQAAARQAVYDKYSNDNFNDSWKGPLPSKANIDALKTKYNPPKNPLLGMTPQEIAAYGKDNNLSSAQMAALKKDLPPTPATSRNPFAGAKASAGYYSNSMYGGADFYSMAPSVPGGPLTFSATGVTDNARDARLLSTDVSTGNNAGAGVFGSNHPGNTFKDKVNNVFQLGRDIIAGSVYSQAGNNIDCSSGICKAPNSFYLVDTKIGNKDIKLGINSALILKSGILGEKYPTPNEYMTGVSKTACLSTFGTSTCDAKNQTANVILHSNAGTLAVLTAAALENTGFQVNNVVGYEARLSQTSDNKLKTEFGVNQVTNYSAAIDTGIDLRINKDKKVDVQAKNLFGFAIQLGAAMDGGYRPYDGYVDASSIFEHHTGDKDGHKVPTNVIQTLKEDLNTPPKSSQPQVNYCPGTTQPAPKRLELPKNFDPSKIFVPKIKVVNASSIPDLPDFNPASLTPQ